MGDIRFSRCGKEICRRTQYFYGPILYIYFLMVCSLFCGSIVVGQTPEQLAHATKSLSPQSQSILNRLTELTNLRSPEWKVHIGDLMHGEDPALDDSQWAKNTPNFEMPADRAMWYRASIEVPKLFHGYDLTGSRIWFQFRFSGATLFPAIVYFGGLRVAMGEALEPIALFDKAQPGDKILVAVKLPAIGDTKHFRDTLLRIQPAASRPDFEALRQELIVASALLLSPAHLISSESLALDRAIQSIDFAALDRGDQTSFDESLKLAQSEVASLRPYLRRFTFHLAGNSHIDAAWLWPWTETVDVVKRTFGTALQLMHEYPDYTYTQSAAQYNEWMAECTSPR